MKLLARFLSQATSEETILLTLKAWLEDDNSGNDNILQLIAAIIYMKVGDNKEALRAVRNGTTLEQ